MADNKYVDVILDNKTVDVTKEVGLVWSIANSLRGAYTSDKYKDVIIPISSRGCPVFVCIIWIIPVFQSILSNVRFCTSLSLNPSLETSNKMA